VSFFLMFMVNLLFLRASGAGREGADLSLWCTRCGMLLPTAGAKDRDRSIPDAHLDGDHGANDTYAPIL
jgi:hypothetical protein